MVQVLTHPLFFGRFGEPLVGSWDHRCGRVERQRIKRPRGVRWDYDFNVRHGHIGCMILPKIDLFQWISTFFCFLLKPVPLWVPENSHPATPGDASLDGSSEGSGDQLGGWLWGARPQQDGRLGNHLWSVGANKNCRSPCSTRTTVVAGNSRCNIVKGASYCEINNKRFF